MKGSANSYKHASTPTGVHVCGAGSEGYSWIGAYKHASASKHKCLQVWAEANGPSSTSMSASMWVCKCFRAYDHKRVSAYKHMSIQASI